MTKVAVASMGTVPEAWVGVRFGLCSQFLVFDLDTLEYVLLSVPPRPEGKDQVSLGAIRALAHHDVSVVITGEIKPICRQAMLDLGMEVIEGVKGMTVDQAIHLYKATGLATPALRNGLPQRVAVVSRAGGLDAPVERHFDTCTSFVVVDPRTLEWERVEFEADGPSHKVSFHGIQAIVRSGATVLITPEINPECCAALQALAVEVYLAPDGITIREAVERYQRGELEESPMSIWRVGGEA